jgi:hypothetical protein
VKCLLTIACLACLALPLTAQGAIVFGYLRRRVPGGNEFPAQGVMVTLYCTSSNLGRSNRSYSDPNGVWVQRGIPPGQYVVEIWVNSNRPWTFPLVVNRPQINMGVLYIP